MTPLRNWFSLKLAQKDHDFLRAQLLAHDPAIYTLDQRQQEESVCNLARRHIWNSRPNKPDGSESNPPRNLDNGLDVCYWWAEWGALNEGLGPRTLCGTMMRGYAAYMAELGHYTRMVGAVGPGGPTDPDNQAEYWDTLQHSWVFRNVGCGVIYVNPLTGVRLSYISMSTFARNGESDKFHPVSATGHQALHPAADRYRHWHRWIHDAAVSNGNATFIGQPHDWKMMRVWPPQPGEVSVWLPRWTEENVPKHILSPDPTATTLSTT